MDFGGGRMNLRYFDIGKIKKNWRKEKENNLQSKSRRRFLQGFGLCILSFSPGLKLFASSISDGIYYKQQKNAVTFFSEFGDRWEINANTFGRNSSLRFRAAKNRYVIRLRNATYPSTDIRFDFKAILYKEFDWRIRFSFRYLDIEEDFKFSTWLKGEEALRGSSYLSERIRVGKRYTLDLKDHIHYIIDKYWKIEFKGKSLTFSNEKENYCNLNQLELRPHVNASGLKHSLKNGLGISFLTNKASVLSEMWYSGKSHNLTYKDEPKFQIQITKGVNGRSNKVDLIEATCLSKNKAAIHYTTNGNNANYALELYHARFFMESSEEKDKMVLLASLADKGQWIYEDDKSILLGNKDLQSPSFQMYASNGKVDRVIGTASVLASHYLLPEVLSLPVDYPEKPDVELNFQQQKVQSKKKVLTDARLGTIKFKEKEIIRLSVLRPEDMLFLQFEFYNFKYIKKDQQSFLEIDNKKKPAAMIVIFPPQHTLEQAFWENNSLPGGEGNENVILPAQYIRSGKSRLVYHIPSGFEGMPIIMSELLNWSRFKLRVNYRARVIEPVKVVVNKFQELNKLILAPKSKLNKISKQSLSVRKYGKNKLKQNDLYSRTALNKSLPASVSGQLYAKINYAALKKYLLEMKAPGTFETSIEAPTRLFISPNQLAGFAHRNKIVLKDHKEQKKGNIQNLQINNPLVKNEGKISELWHSRLGVRLKNGEVDETILEGFKTIRALWARDARKKLTPKPARNIPFRTALDGRDRHNIVHQTSNYLIKGYSPKSVKANRLMLSSLGAWLDFYANFNTPDFHDQPDLELLEWEHLATLGRDHYVKVVEAGFLFPFGHTASLVKITERKPDKSTKAAVNRQRMYIVILEPIVYYQMSDPQNGFLPFPFQSVELLASKTPDLDAPVDLVSLGGDYNFWIRSGAKDLQFDLLLTDQEGEEQKIDLPLIFVGKSAAYNKGKMESLVTKYNTEVNRSKADFNRQNVAYSRSLIEGDTQFETSEIHYGAKVLEGKPATILKYHPIVRTAKVKVEAIEELTGNANPVLIELQDDNNNAKIFAKVLESLKADFSGESDKSGGFMSPNTQITSLSKLKGPLGGAVDKLKDLDFDPQEFFGSSGDMPVAKLFGVVSVFDLLLGNLNFGAEGNQQASALNGLSGEMESIKEQILEQEAELENAVDAAKDAIEQEIQNLKGQLSSKINELEQQLSDQVPRIPNLNTYKTDKAFVVEYRWIPEMESSKSLFGGFLTVNVQKPNEALQVLSKLSRPFDTAQQTDFSVDASFTDFSVEIKELIRVGFKSLRFGGGSGQKADVKVEMQEDDSILFLGPLSFVNQLQNLIPSNGFANGPYVKLSPAGVSAGFDLAIPSVEVGVCTIANMTLGAGVHLPFTGAPLTLKFNFCKREAPFLLTVSAFGGGGYFLMKTSVKGFVGMEAAFEFGAALSMNFGVASGGVSVMGGFYFSMEIVEDHTETILTGYIRFNGYLSILGIISLSIEIYLAFVAMFQNGKVEKLYGEAIVKVKIEVLFFSKTVSLTARRELKGADADPTFQMIMEENDWLEYCQAYA